MLRYWGVCGFAAACLGETGALRVRAEVTPSDMLGRAGVAGLAVLARLFKPSFYLCPPRRQEANRPRQEGGSPLRQGREGPPR